MKLLLDENLSRRLVPFLQQAYPGSSQVVLLGLEFTGSQAPLGNPGLGSSGFPCPDPAPSPAAASRSWQDRIPKRELGNQKYLPTVLPELALKLLLENRSLIEDALIAQGFASLEMTL